MVTRMTKGVSFPRWRVTLCHAAIRLISLFVAHYADVAFHPPQVDRSLMCGNRVCNAFDECTRCLAAGSLA